MAQLKNRNHSTSLIENDDDEESFTDSEDDDKELILKEGQIQKISRHKLVMSLPPQPMRMSQKERLL